MSVNVCQLVTGTSTTCRPRLLQIISFEGTYIGSQIDIICFSETYLDSTLTLDDENSVISGYNLICSDHPSNAKRRDVCLDYKNYLPLILLNISYLK